MKFLLLFLLLTSNAYAKLNIQHWTTPEGAKVLFTHTKGLPIVDVSAIFDAASSRDGTQYGLAALTNSLIGSATKQQNEEQIIHAFESLGAQFSTSSLKDMSFISLRTLSREPILTQALGVFSEVISQPSFKQKYLTRAKRQTLQSIRAGKQSPASVASIAFNKAVFGKHPYAHETIGTASTIKDITLQDLRRHYQQFYVAKNLTIALVGDISRAKAKQIARQISHGFNMGEKAKANSIVRSLDKAQTLLIDFPSEQTHLRIGQTGINRSHPDYYALYLGNHMFGGSGLTSILGDEIREQRALAYSAYSYFDKMQSNGTFVMNMQTKNTQANSAKAIAIQSLNDFINKPMDEQRFQDAKDNIIGGFALKTSSNANILVYLSIVGFYNLPLDYLNTFIDKIKNISAQEVQEAFKKLIHTDKLVVVSVGQQKK